MRVEATVDDCMIVGERLPAEMNGGFYRNGPEWRRSSKQRQTGLYSVDGMVQGLVIRDGRAHFRNRWVRTPKFVAEEQAGRGLFEWTDGEFRDYRTWAIGDVIRDDLAAGVPYGTNYVNVVPFAGEVLAIGEMGAPPCVLDPLTLETRGLVPWSTALPAGLVAPAADGAFTAHPKWDPDTGELFGWSFRDERPFVTLHWVATDGTVRSRDLDDAPYNSLVHDMWLTDRYVVLPFQPLIISRARINAGLSGFGWDPELPIVLALVPRGDIHGEVRWITADVETQYLMHTMSANHDGDLLVLDGPIFEEPPFPFENRHDPGDPFPDFWTLSPGRTGRWTIDLVTETVKSEVVGDVPVEFPKVDERFYGRPYQWGFFLAGVERGMKFDTLVRRNVRTGAEDSYRIVTDAPLALAEPTFVPRRPGAPEGDGYLIVPTSNRLNNQAEFLLFDTEDISAGPRTRIQIPFALGWTPHGHWMSF